MEICLSTGSGESLEELESLPPSTGGDKRSTRVLLSEAFLEMGDGNKANDVLGVCDISPVDLDRRAGSGLENVDSDDPSWILEAAIDSTSLPPPPPVLEAVPVCLASVPNSPAV